MTPSTPTRGIKSDSGSRFPGSAARRAIEVDHTGSHRSWLSESAIFRVGLPKALSPDDDEVAAPVGRPELQLIGSFVVTALIVFAFTVAIPLLMHWMRHF